MQAHVKIYMQAHGYGEQDFIPCESCGSRSVDVHHIHGRIGKRANDISNLQALCRKCHAEKHGVIIKGD